MRPLASSLLLAALSLPAAFAQTPTPPCSGSVVVARTSEITPDGSLEKFMAAVAAHQAWYTAHNLPDKIFAARVYDLDPATGSTIYSTTKIMTYHLYATDPSARPKSDASWDAYVKLYNQTSKLKDTVIACFPKGSLPQPI